MKEYKIGEQILLEVVQADYISEERRCKGCFFKNGTHCNIAAIEHKCSMGSRSDGKNVIFVEKKGKQ